MQELGKSRCRSSALKDVIGHLQKREVETLSKERVAEIDLIIW